MAVAIGNKGQLMFAREATQNTRQAPDHSIAFLQESLKARTAFRASSGIRAGRKTPIHKKPGTIDVSGSFAFELQAETLIPIWAWCIGGANPTPTGAGPYTYVLTPGDLPTLTVQVDRDLENPFDYTGLMCNQWTLRQSPDANAQMEVQAMGYKELTDQTKGTFAENAAPTLFAFDELTITALGESVCVDTLEMTGVNEITRDYPMCANYGRHARVHDNHMRTVTGTLAHSIEDLTEYNKSVLGTEGTLTAQWSDGTYSITIDLSVYFPQDTPNVGGPAEVKHNLPFEMVGGATDAANLTVTVVNDEAAA